MTFSGATKRMIRDKLRTIAGTLQTDKLDRYTINTVLRYYLYTRNRKVHPLLLDRKLSEWFTVDEDWIYISDPRYDVTGADRYALLYILFTELSPEEIYSTEDILKILQENYDGTVLAKMSANRLRTALGELANGGAITKVQDEATKKNSRFVYWCLNDLRGILDSFWYGRLEGGIYTIKR